MSINKFENTTPTASDKIDAKTQDTLKSMGVNVNDNTKLVEDRITAGDVIEALGRVDPNTPIIAVLGLPGQRALGFFDILGVAVAHDSKRDEQVVAVQIIPEGL